MEPSALIRALGALGSLLGPAPLLALRCARAAERDAGRSMILRHMARVRRRAGVSLRVAGEHHVPQRSGFVLVYNQTSLADDLGNLDVLWRYIDLSALAAEYGLLPFFPQAAERVGLVLVRRGNRSATDLVLRRLGEAAAAGRRISMAAEGRLSPDGEVGHFKRGAFLVAIRGGVPVVPMCVQGGRGILAPGSVQMRPGVLRYRFGPPLASQGYAEQDAAELAERARGAVARLYREEAARSESPADLPRPGRPG